MNKTVLYKTKTLLRLLFVSELVIGTSVIVFFIYLFINEIYPDIWAFAGPMLGLAFFVAGLTGSKIKEIYLNSSNNCIEITRESLFKVRFNQIDQLNMKVELKTANNKKNSLIPKFKLTIIESDKEIEKLESGFLSMNNDKIEKLYKDLKSIVKIANASK